MSTRTKVVWREWFNESAVAKLTEMGTLPRNETEIDCRFEDGAGVARLIAEEVSQYDSKAFREGGDIVILEPAEFAGEYEICVDYEPSFSAYEKS